MNEYDNDDKVDRPPRGNKALKVLKEPDYGIFKVAQPLARIFRVLLAEDGVTPCDWSSLLQKWQVRLHKGRDIPTKEVTTAKSNATKILFKASITWNSLMRAFAILGYSEITVTFAAKKPHARNARVVSFTIDNLDRYGDFSIDEELEPVEPEEPQ